MSDDGLLVPPDARVKAAEAVVDTAAEDATDVVTADPDGDDVAAASTVVAGDAPAPAVDQSTPNVAGAAGDAAAIDAPKTVVDAAIDAGVDEAAAKRVKVAETAS